MELRDGALSTLMDVATSAASIAQLQGRDAAPGPKTALAPHENSAGRERRTLALRAVSVRYARRVDSRGGSVP